MWRNRKPDISYFRPFGCVCFILNTNENLNKFDSKSHKCFMLGYSERSKGFRVYNTETQIMEESIHVLFDDKLGNQKPKHAKNSAGLEIDLSDSEELEVTPKSSPESKNHSEATTDGNSEINPLAADLNNLRIFAESTQQKRSPRITSSHPEEMIIGKKDDPIRTRSFHRSCETSLFGLVSIIEPTSVEEALQDNDWILAMQDELNQCCWFAQKRFLCGTHVSFVKKKGFINSLVRQKSVLIYCCLASQINAYRKVVLVSQINSSENVLLFGLSEVYLMRRFELKR